MFCNITGREVDSSICSRCAGKCGSRYLNEQKTQKLPEGGQWVE